MSHIVVFYGTGCSACHEEMEFLRRCGIPFTAKDVVSDLDARNELLKLGAKTLPTTLVDGQVLVGFQKERLSELLGIA